MKSERKLFPSMRVCVCCGAERQSSHGKRIHDGPSILAITPTMYRYADGNRVLTSARRVQVCEACFQKVLTSDPSKPNQTAYRYWNAMRESMAARYSELLGEESSK